MFLLTGKAVYNGISDGYRILVARFQGKGYVQVHKPQKTKDATVVDSASDDEIVKLWMWLPGLVAVVALTCVVMRGQFGMPIMETLLALFLAFFFSFLAVQATGATGKQSNYEINSISPIIQWILTWCRHHTFDRGIKGFSDNSRISHQRRTLDPGAVTAHEPSWRCTR